MGPKKTFNGRCHKRFGIFATASMAVLFLSGCGKDNRHDAFHNDDFYRHLKQPSASEIKPLPLSGGMAM